MIVTYKLLFQMNSASFAPWRTNQKAKQADLMTCRETLVELNVDPGAHVVLVKDSCCKSLTFYCETLITVNIKSALSLR